MKEGPGDECQMAGQTHPWKCAMFQAYVIINAGDGHCLFALPSKERSVCSHTGEGMFRLGFTITTCKVLSSLLDL